MNNERRIIWIILIGVIAFTAVSSVKWFFNNFEKQETEVTSGYSYEARRNIFLAVEYYLRELGHDVESDSNRARLLEKHESNQTILLNDYGPKLSPSHFKELKQWIESGGHLIFTAQDFDYFYNEEDENNFSNDEFKNNQLLEEYGIIPRYTDYDVNKEEEDGISSYILKNQAEIKIDFSTSTILLDKNGLSSFSLRDKYGAHLLQLDIGKGKLTILSDNYFLNNESIGEHDHAYLLSILSEANRAEKKKFLLLYNTKSDSIFSLIWKHGKLACIAFFALLILFLWSMRNRFGPILPNTTYAHRNISEHLRAIARFSWRQDHGVHLLNQSRKSCESALLKRYPVMKQMSTTERLEHISDILDIEAEKVHSALYFEPKSTNEYITSSHHLQKIWILQ